MLTLLIAALAAQAPSVSRIERIPREGGRESGRRAGAAFAFFEAFPANGAGTTTACSTTAPTGAKGEVLTFTRASSGTCTRTATGGLATTGIADGDLVTLSSNVARVEYDSAGVLGLLVESSRTNSLLRFIELCDAAWANVGTPALTGATVTGTACATTTPQASPFTGTFATAAVLFDDNDGAAFEGRSQSVPVSEGAAYTAHCLVKAGTATSARIVLDGTAATKTGLVTGSWDIIEVTDTSSSGVSIVFEVDVGSVATTTGTVVFGGCQVEAGSYRTSIIPTTSAAVTREVETARFTFPSTMSNASGASWAGTMTFPTGWSATPFDGIGSPYADVTNRNQAYWQASNATTCSHISTGANRDAVTPGGATGTVERLACATGAIGTGNITAYRNGVSGTPVALGAATAFTAIDWRGIGGLSANAAGSQIISRLCYQPGSETRCR